MTILDFLTTVFVLLFLFGLIALLLWLEKPIRDRSKKLLDVKLKYYTSAAHLIDEIIDDLPEIRKSRFYICESGYIFCQIYDKCIKNCSYLEGK